MADLLPEDPQLRRHREARETRAREQALQSSPAHTTAPSTTQPSQPVPIPSRSQSPSDDLLIERGELEPLLPSRRKVNIKASLSKLALAAKTWVQEKWAAAKEWVQETRYHCEEWYEEKKWAAKIWWYETHWCMPSPPSPSVSSDDFDEDDPFFATYSNWLYRSNRLSARRAREAAGQPAAPPPTPTSILPGPAQPRGPYNPMRRSGLRHQVRADDLPGVPSASPPAQQEPRSSPRIAWDWGRWSATPGAGRGALMDFRG